MLAANPGYAFIGDAQREQLLVKSSRYVYSIAAHGCLNVQMDMNSIFTVSGKGIESGIVPWRADSRSVASTVAAVLGVTLPDVEGKILWGVLRSDVSVQ